jgi:putative DNA primase/helicase
MSNTNKVTTLDELRAKTGRKGGAEKPNAFIDDEAFLTEHFTMLHGSEFVWDNFYGRTMKVSHLQKSAPMSFKIWNSNPFRKIIDIKKLVFDPVSAEKGEIINLFRGLPMQRKAGDCELIKDLLLTLCNGDVGLAHWITCWIAYPLQNIGAKMQTSVVMRGWKNGTGKNLFWEEVVLPMYGDYGQTIDQADVEGSYNGWASSKLFIVADEVVSPGEKWHIKGMLKRMITGKTIRISEKYQPSRTEGNFCNFVFLSNENVPLPIDSDDRRFTIVEPNIKRENDYYKSIGESIKNGSIEAFYDYLLNYPIGDFNAHTKPPETAAKQEIVELSMRSHERFVHEWTNQQTIFEFEPVYSEAIFIAYQVWCKRNGEKSTNLNTLARELNKSVDMDRRVHPGSRDKKRIYFPKGWTTAPSWSGLDGFYESVKALAEQESKVKL